MLAHVKTAQACDVEHYVTSRSQIIKKRDKISRFMVNIFGDAILNMRLSYNNKFQENMYH